MAATNGTTTHLTAGPPMSSAPITAEETQEYERILKISEEIFSGSHPRLKVPQKFVRKPKTQSGQASPLPQQVAKSKPAITEPPVRLETSRNTNSTQSSTVEYAPSPISTNTAPAARVPFKPASSIDPIFLTKSDDLLKAELQLQRQRVERTLRDQLEQRKQDGKQKPNIQDIKPEFDVSDVLNKAFDIVKPVSLSDPSEINATDSFDENSYYSSKAPDSPPLAGEHQNLSPVIPTGPSGAPTGPPVEHYSDELQRLEALNKTGSDQEMPDAYPVADQRISHPQNQLHPNQTEAARRFRDAQEVDIVDEPEYSPPAPVAPPIDHRVYEQVPANSQGKPRYLERPPDAPYYSPGSNVTVVRNHITSPAAPRPSRVSPLATSKVAPIPVRDDRYEPGLGRIDSDPESGRASPAGPAPQVVSRKRRRLQEKGREARVSYKRQNADHSDAYIKEEPVSPPPFTDDPAVVRTRQPQQNPVYIDVESPRYSPALGRREPASRAPIYEIDPYHELPAGQLPPRTVSRLESIRPVRDEAELRRVTSLQYARQPEYPQEYVDHDPHAGRSASYTIVERRQPEQPRYYEDVASYGPRYIQVNEPSQPAYGSQYYEAPQPAHVMPPPPPPPQPQRRYVVDEHGNEFEIVPSRRGQTMAPPSRPASRAPVPQPEIYDDRPPVRTASVRAPSVVQDPYVERRYVQEMPPPQPVYRRVTSDYTRPVAGERPTYAAPLEGHEPYPRSASVQVANYLPRRQAYVEEHTIPQERVIRTASVRPQPQHRYEEPHEVVQRVGDARPAGHGREVSGYMDERAMGEYVERPYYVRERRYFDDESSMALDGNSEQPVHRVSQHY